MEIIKTSLAFTRIVRDETFRQGPENLRGPIMYVPFGIVMCALPVDWHASFHAAMKA